MSTPRTQFDDQLLSATPITGCKLHVQPDGNILTALTIPGDGVRVWRNHELSAHHPATGEVAAPCFDGETVRYSVGEDLLLDTAQGHFLYQKNRQLVLINGTQSIVIAADTGRASLDMANGQVHIVYEHNMGLFYWHNGQTERVAEAYGSHPVVLAHGGRVFIAYLGEMCRLPSYKHWSPAWERLGHGGYIAALVGQAGAWQRFQIADSQQIVKPIRPMDTAYGGGPEVELRIRIEEFSPPALTLGSDGVPQVFWANLDRRWIYGARFLGEEFSQPTTLRGPLEQLTGVAVPKRTPGPLPIAMLTQSRVYLDELCLPARSRIDFVELDEIAEAHGVEVVLNEMERFAGNPVIPAGAPGGDDAGGVLADIWREGEAWKANVAFRGTDKPTSWIWEGHAESADGIHWKKLPREALASRRVIGEDSFRYNIRFLEDPNELDPQCRFKGLWRAEKAGPWGWIAVVSPDALTWTKVNSPAVLNADDDLRIWIDPHAEPARRFKANGISRSFCGRVAAQWTSANGMHWDDERDTLDFRDPFGAKPDRGTTGRILLDSWAGPAEEDELHGGFVFHDGDRWLLHYMKWTTDGHVYCGLAASRDGLNFARVAAGKPTLPLGAPGTWDAGRVAIREAPFRVGDKWRQYYAGSGWKHGFAGIGAKTSPWASQHSSMQMGVAEIPVGHWTHLQLKRAVDAAEVRLVPVTLTQPRRLTVDVAGLGRPGSSLQCAVFAGATPVVDFTNITTDGRAVPVGSVIPAGRVQIVARLTGHGLKLFGFDWQ